ncbi:hypothetical protein J6590_090595 [Homalodisca vitripennis]|nr:hypothetical protein J6590_090595 [Homalodisca vitripennis]
MRQGFTGTAETRHLTPYKAGYVSLSLVDRGSARRCQTQSHYRELRRDEAPREPIAKLHYVSRQCGFYQINADIPQNEIDYQSR